MDGQDEFRALVALCNRYRRRVRLHVIPRLSRQDAEVLKALVEEVIDWALSGREDAVSYMRSVVADPNEMLREFVSVSVRHRAKKGRNPLASCNVRRRVRVARPRERRPGTTRRATRSRSARQSSSSDSSDPPGPGDAGHPRRAVVVDGHDVVVGLVDAWSASGTAGCSHCPHCGAVLLWADGRLVCARRSCPRWGRPA